MRFTQFVVNNRHLTAEELDQIFGSAFLLVSQPRSRSPRSQGDSVTAPHRGLMGGLREGLGNSEVFILDSLVGVDGFLTVGSSPQATIQLTHGSVAEEHLVLRRAGEGTWTVESLTNQRSTTLEGAPILPGHASTLRGGEYLGVGSPYSATFHSARTLRFAIQLADSAAAKEES